MNEPVLAGAHLSKLQLRQELHQAVGLIEDLVLHTGCEDCQKHGRTFLNRRESEDRIPDQPRERVSRLCCQAEWCDTHHRPWGECPAAKELGAIEIAELEKP